MAYGRSLRARIASDRGKIDEAESLAREALEHAYRTDFPLIQAQCLAALGAVLAADGQPEEARADLERSLALLERYGHVLAAERVRGLLVEL